MKNENTTNEDVKNEEKPKIRQIVIETDGTDIKIVKAEVAGKIELTAIFERLIFFLNQKQEK